MDRPSRKHRPWTRPRHRSDRPDRQCVLDSSILAGQSPVETPGHGVTYRCNHPASRARLLRHHRPCERLMRFREGARRLLLIAAGICLVGIGGIGVFIPGLPSTVFFIGASWCFARSSERLQRWLLGLPVVGQLVQDYRSGLGMPRRAKRSAVTMIIVACALSAWTTAPLVWVPVAIVAAGIVGIWYVTTQVPTKEVVEAQMSAESTRAGHHQADQAPQRPTG